MRAGDLDRRVIIQTYAITGVDPFNNPIGEWQDVATVWAQVLQQGGSEFLRAEEVTAERRVVFRIRWLEGVSALQRVIHDGTEHNITEVRELGRRDGLELHTTAADAG